MLYFTLSHTFFLERITSSFTSGQTVLCTGHTLSVLLLIEVKADSMMAMVSLSFSAIYCLRLFQYVTTSSILSLSGSLSIHSACAHLSLYQPCIRNLSSLLYHCQHLLLLILQTIVILTAVRFQCKCNFNSHFHNG